MKSRNPTIQILLIAISLWFQLVPCCVGHAIFNWAATSKSVSSTSTCGSCCQHAEESDGPSDSSVPNECPCKKHHCRFCHPEALAAKYDLQSIQTNFDICWNRLQPSRLVLNPCNTVTRASIYSPSTNHWLSWPVFPLRI